MKSTIATTLVACQDTNNTNHKRSNHADELDKEAKALLNRAALCPLLYLNVRNECMID